MLNAACIQNGCVIFERISIVIADHQNDAQVFQKATIETYFSGEKSGSLVLLIMGVAALAAGIILLIGVRTTFWRGVAVPLIIIGCLLAIVGYTVYARSDADRIRNVYALDMNPTELKEKEVPRMEKVMRNFVIYRWVEIALLLAGLMVWFRFRHAESMAYWKGLGAALSLMAVIALAADYFAEKRGSIYLEGLKEWVKGS